MNATAIAQDGAERRSSAFLRVYYGQTRFDFVRRRKWWFGASALLITAGLISLGVKGLNYSIEFVGGTSWQVPAPGVTVSQAQTALTPLGLGGATITVLGSGSTQTLNVEAKLAKNASGLSACRDERGGRRSWPFDPQAGVGGVDRIRRPDLGRQHHSQGGRGADRLPHSDRGLHLDLLRVEDGDRGDPGGRPRHHHHGGDLLSGVVPRDA